MNLGNRLVELRKEREMTQEILAEVLHVTRQTISNWENGKSYPDIQMLVQISETFDISLDTLLKGDKKMVKEMTKEQRKGRRKTTMLIALCITVLAIAGLKFYEWNHSYYELRPDEYDIAVKEITLDDVALDNDKGIALYEDSSLEGRFYGVEGTEAPEDGMYLFEGSELLNLLTGGHAYEIILTTKGPVGTSVYETEEDGKTLGLDVMRTEFDRMFGQNQESTTTIIMWCKEMNRLVDSYDSGKITVWKK